MEAIVLKRFYREMVRIRKAEERIVALYPEQEIRCPVHLCAGQEAIAVGVCANLTHEDLVLSGHRSHGHYLAKGGDLTAMFAEMYGRETGCSSGRGGSMHLIDLSVGFAGATPIVASTIAIAVGVAMGMVMRNEPVVTVAFFGDAATEEGVFYESVNLAVLKELPVIFVCENNFYSVYSPQQVRRPKGLEIAAMVSGFGIESQQGDGNNVREVHELAQEAVCKARGGRGPSFLEFKTYRWREHCGPNYDDNLGYRSEEESREWRARCPIERLRRELVSEGILRQDDIGSIDRGIDDELEMAVESAQRAPFPASDSLERHVFAS